jgi:hypothetical protein
LPAISFEDRPKKCQAKILAISPTSNCMPLGILNLCKFDNFDAQ